MTASVVSYEIGQVLCDLLDSNISCLFRHCIDIILLGLSLLVKLGVEETRSKDSVALCGVEGIKSTVSRNRVSVGASWEISSGKWAAMVGDVVAVSS